MITVEKVEKQMRKKNPNTEIESAPKVGGNRKMIIYGLIGIVAIGSAYFAAKKFIVKKPPEIAAVQPMEMGVPNMQ